MYQRRYDENGDLHVGGASTLLSRAKNKKAYPETKGQIHYNQIGKPWYDENLPEGAVILKESGRTYEETKPVKDEHGNVMYYEDTGKPIKVKTGKVKVATQDRPQMAMTNDARTLVSAIRSEPELLYADYANKLKAMANEARKTMMYTKGLQYNPSAKKEYAQEVESLKAKLDQAFRAKPKEARAQNIALGIINEKLKADHNLTPKEIKKIRQIAIETARAQVGVRREDKEIKLTDREWAAIQAGAISNNRLEQILQNTNPDSLRERATPSNGRALSNAQEAQIRNMHNGFYTIAEIADAMGVSTSTVSRVLKGA
jgi:predicted DNA binding protein